MSVPVTMVVLSTSLQRFIGSHYFCESGNPNSTTHHSILYTSDPLWDGQDCGSVMKDHVVQLLVSHGSTGTTVALPLLTTLS